MKTSVIAACVLVCARAWGAQPEMDWAYHDDDDDTDDRATEKVPGESYTFISNATTTVQSSDTITLYVLLPHDLRRARAEDEDVLVVRWWNGQSENLIRAKFEKSVYIGRGTKAVGKFHGLPESRKRLVDLWKVNVPPNVTHWGDNYYFFRFYTKDENRLNVVRYLMASDPDHDNNFGQAWSPVSENFGRDWKITISP